MKLRKEESSKRITVIIPDHKELAPGTVQGILRQAGIASETFLLVHQEEK